MGLIDSISETNDKAAAVSEKYLNKSYKFYKLKTFQQLSISVSTVIKGLLIFVTLFMCMVFSLIALALYIGKSINSYPIGFLSIGILFLALAALAYFLRGYINTLVIEKLSKKFFK